MRSAIGCSTAIMMAQMLPHTDTERISRLLPIVKCSTCSSTVSLDALGDHVCPASSSPPMLPPFSINKTSPLSASALEKSLNFSSSRKSPPLSLRTGGETVRVRTLSNARKSPSPITDNFHPPTRSASKQPPLPTSSIPFPVQRDVASPRRPDFVPHRPRQESLNVGNRGNNASPLAMRTVTPSNMSAPSAYSQPSVATTVRTPYGLPSNDPSRQYYPHENISTISGGEAGMAGVGRRGFAAAARSAMFAASYQRRADPPRFLDIDAAQRASTETPPLSAGSSHSAGQTSPFPKTPASPIPPPAGQFHPSTMALPHSPAHKSFLDLSPTTPTKPGLNTRLPFFEKFKNKMPGAQVLATNHQDLIYETSGQKSAKPDTPRTAVPIDHSKSQSSDYRRLPSPPSEADSASNYAPSPPSRNISLSSTTPRRVHKADGYQSNPSSDSERGLAYVDSDTDNSEYSSRSSKKGSAPPTPLPTSILRTGSIATMSHVRFPSNDTMSTMRTGRPIIPAMTGWSNAPDPAAYQRKDSASSVSSTSSIGGRQRTNSSIIAQALGLSGTPPRDYEILGGPGVTGFGDREGRKSSGQSRASSRSRSRHPSEERAMKLSINTSPTSRSTGSTNSGPPPPSPSTKRSNTVQTHHNSTTEARPPKLPTRSNTTPVVDRAKQFDGHATDRNGDRKDKGRKVRICVKCDNKIEDGRWVQCDSGTVLCDLCWKSMYLPRCRRCNKAIEKQAVSSSDGQLKGKYHRECFNCHVCHKPFPDKTFYVFDSKPLCAYHYHQANKSLCSAPKCGQPIEGPCAVSHTGERYHPEHFTCEYPGHPRCSEKLVEYWEVDGRMLCEWHAPAAGRAGTVEGSFYHDSRAKTTKAMKRVTRFIDLPNGIGGVGDSDLL